MDRERVKSGEILVGEPLPWDVFREDGRLLMQKGFVIENERQLKALLSRGVYCKVPTPVEAAELQPFDLLNEIRKRLEIYSDNYGNEEAFPSQIVELSRMIQQVCDRNADASLAYIHLKQEGRYPVTHSIQAALICEVISKYLGWTDSDRLSLLAAALTMNIAIIDLQTRLYSHKGHLNDKQRLEIVGHPVLGREILNKCGVTDNTWLDMVLQHHEYLDGSGYPAGLKGDEISQLGRILTISDVYCAKISPRAYRLPLLPNQAMQDVFLKNRIRFIDKQLASIFIKKMGIYPPGTFVQLKNGEFGIVTHCGEKAHCPVVRCFVNSNGMPLPQSVQRDTGDGKFAVVYAINPDKMNVQINHELLWQSESK